MISPSKNSSHFDPFDKKVATLDAQKDADLAKRKQSDHDRQVLQIKIDNAKRESDHIKIEMGSKEAKLTTLKREHDDIVQSIVRLKNQITHDESTLRNLGIGHQSKEAVSREVVDKLKAKAETLHRERQTTEVKYAEQKADIEASHRRIDTKKHELMALSHSAFGTVHTDSISQKKSALSQKKRKIETLRAEVEMLEREYESDSRSIEMLEKSATTKEIEEKQNTDAMRQIDFDIKQTEQSLLRKEQDYRTLERELTHLKTEEESASREYTASEATYGQTHKAVYIQDRSVDAKHDLLARAKTDLLSLEHKEGLSSNQIKIIGDECTRLKNSFEVKERDTTLLKTQFAQIR